MLSDVKVGRAVDGRFADDVEAQLAELRERSRTAHDELLEAGVRHAHGRRISGR